MDVVPTSEPPMPTNEPPMPQNDEMPMGGPLDQPTMDQESEEGENDPKKSIQQLVGKLSQELRTYNDNQQEQDTDLNKYVAGMIIPQATKVMTDQDKNEVIDKIQNGGSNNNQPQMDDDQVVNEVINSLVNDKKEPRFEKHITNQDVKSRQNPFKTNR